MSLLGSSSSSGGNGGASGGSGASGGDGRVVNDKEAVAGKAKTVISRKLVEAVKDLQVSSCHCVHLGSGASDPPICLYYLV